jgi:uridine kinase
MSHFEDGAGSSMSIGLRGVVKRRNDRLVSEVASQLTRLARSNGRPAMVAVNGKTAVGKSTFTRRLRDRVMGDEASGRVSCAYLATDAWLREGRLEREARGLTGLDASAYDLDGLEAATRRLRNREAAVTPVYNHRAGVHDGFQEVDAADLVIIEGLMSTHPRLMPLLDAVYWIDCTESNHKRFRIKRNTHERGYTREAAEENYRKLLSRWDSWLAEMKPSQLVTLRVNRIRMMRLDDRGEVA